MSYYARGDMRKMVHSSEEDEGYSNDTLFSGFTIRLMSQLHFHDKRHGLPETSGEALPVPLPPISDDTDCQFWAGDELSSSESRLRLSNRQKRRRSLSYRNRIAVQRGRSLLFHSSSSSSDQKSFKMTSSAWRRRTYRQPAINRNNRTHILGSMTNNATNTRISSRTANIEKKSLQLTTDKNQRSGRQDFSLRRVRNEKSEENSKENQSPCTSSVVNCQRSRNSNYFNSKGGRIRKEWRLRKLHKK